MERRSKSPVLNPRSQERTNKFAIDQLNWLKQRDEKVLEAQLEAVKAIESQREKASNPIANLGLKKRIAPSNHLSVLSNYDERVQRY